MNVSLNTHDYDNNAREIYSALVAADPKKNEPLTEFPIVLQQVFIFIQSFRGPVQLKNNAHLALILFKQDTKNNRDQSGLTVEDILPRIWRLLDRSDHDSILYFVEQLADIKTMGSCNNGRINRLLQVYNCLIPVHNIILN